MSEVDSDEAALAAFFEAVVADDRSKVRRLLAAGRNPAQRDAAGRAPLHLARSLAVVELLLEYGAEVDARDHAGITPSMVHAGRSDALAIVERLLAAGADPTLYAGGSTALTWAARADEPAIVERLLAAGCPIDAEPGATGPLHVAVARGKATLVERLLDAGANLEARDRGPLGLLAPLHLAAIYDHADIVRLLVARGADVRATTHEAPEDSQGFTALHFAAEYGHVDVLAELLRRDPDAIACTSASGKRPWDLADDRMVKVLLLTVGRGAGVEEFERLRAGLHAKAALRVVDPSHD